MRRRGSSRRHFVISRGVLVMVEFIHFFVVRRFEQRWGRCQATGARGGWMVESHDVH